MKGTSYFSREDLLDVKAKGIMENVRDVKIYPEEFLKVIQEEVAVRKLADSLRYCVTWDDPMSMW